MNLYPHNQQAYEAVMKHYGEGNRKAAAIQPTGSGKSYMGGAVASHFSKVLIVAPNEYVYNQAKATTPHADTITYTMLSIREDMPTGYDLIWFDEFHRIGAPTWQGGVDRLIDANPNAKILGTTATPDRALEQRNMADEFFDGDVVSNMSLTDAWVNHILRVPKYVIGVVSMGSTQADYTERINASVRINAAQKKEATALLDNIVRDWSYSYGVPQILHKYIDSDVERMIVFAQTINKLDEVVSSIRPWFNEANINVANVYSVHSGMGIEAKRQLEAFENDTKEGVKVLVCVDMLNEGIHVERVDAVMLLRSTISKNLYMQQIGRCFAVGQMHQPIILDLADNLTSACGYDGIYEAQKRYAERSKESESSNHTPDEFMVVDTLKETREIISQIDKMVAERRSYTLEECIEAAKPYKSRVEYRNGSPREYRYTLAMGWTDIVMAHLTNLRHWTKELLIAEARKYKTRSELMKANPGAYTTIINSDFKDEAFAHMETLQRHWTKEEVAQEALKYNTLNAFKDGSFSAFNWAYAHKCMNEVTGHMKKKNSWDYEKVKAAAKECTTRTEFNEKYPGAMLYAQRHKIVDDVCSHMKEIVRWTLDECKEIALRYQSPNAMRIGDPRAYDAIIAHKWNNICFVHMIHKRNHPFKTKEACFAEAKKYTKRTDFEKGSPVAFRAAKRNGWYNDCVAHMPSCNDTRYTLDVCKAEAKKYKDLPSFRKNAEPYYRAAKRNNWLDLLEYA